MLFVLFHILIHPSRMDGRIPANLSVCLSLGAGLISNSEFALKLQVWIYHCFTLEMKKIIKLLVFFLLSKFSLALYIYV